MSLKNASNWLLSQNSFVQQSEVKNVFHQEHVAKVISVVSGKGGVGKTSVSIKLGKLLAKKDYKVLLIDCDYNLSNTYIKLGIKNTTNFYDYSKGALGFLDALYIDGNFHLLSACNGNIDWFETAPDLDKMVIDILREQEKNYDYIILDCPAGISRQVLNLNAYSDFRLTVVSPDKSSITDSYSLMKILNSKYGVNSNFLLVNKVSTHKQYSRIVQIMSETVENFLNGKLMVLGNIKKDDSSVDKFDLNLLSEDSELNDDFQKVATRLIQLTQDDVSLDNETQNIFITKKQDVSHNNGQGVSNVLTC